MNITTLPAEELLAAGPEGPIFGRAFDMAHFAWTPANYHLCPLFLSSEIPGPSPDFSKSWSGGNASGYANEVFDTACRESMYSLSDLESTQEARAEAQRLLAEGVPALQLYFRQDIYIAEFSFNDLHDGYYTPLWNIESLPFDRQPCQAVGHPLERDWRARVSEGGDRCFIRLGPVLPAGQRHKDFMVGKMVPPICPRSRIFPYKTMKNIHKLRDIAQVALCND